jgi:hypothetical protein
MRDMSMKECEEHNRETLKLRRRVGMTNTELVEEYQRLKKEADETLKIFQYRQPPAQRVRAILFPILLGYVSWDVLSRFVLPLFPHR